MSRDKAHHRLTFLNPARLLAIGALLSVSLPLLTSSCTKKRTLAPPEVERSGLELISDALEVSIYFDATLSMKGFVSTTTASNYQLIVPLLERAVIEGWNGGQARFFKFGDDIAPLPGRDYLNAAKSSFYADSKYNRKTLIERVIEQAKPQGLTVIVTDLFQNNADVNQLSDKLKQKFIANNMAVGIYAVRSQFSGTVYDVGPDNYTFAYASGEPATERPFYLVALGSHADIAHYFGVLGNIGVDTFPEKHSLIFSRHVVARQPPFTRAKLKTADKISEVSNSNLVSGNYSGDSVKAFKITKGKTEASFSVELPYDAALGNALNHGSALTPEITAWKGEETGSNELALVENQNARSALRVAARLTPEQAPFSGLELRADLNVSELPASGVYRYRIVLRPSSYVLPGWVAAWNMRDAEVRDWHQRPKEFNGAKTYNLENFLGTLQGSVLSTTPPVVCDVYCYIRVDK